MKNKRFLFLLLPVLTVVLEALPYGAVLVFGAPASDGTIGYFREHFSYFSLTPFGYANFGPLLTAAVTCIVFVLLFIYCITGKPALLRFARNMLAVGVVFSLLPLLLGFRFYSLVGALITATLAAELVLLHRAVKSGSHHQ